MDQQEYIDELIIKCLSGEAGVDESKELSRWMDADKEHFGLFPEDEEYLGYLSSCF